MKIILSLLALTTLVYTALAINANPYEYLAAEWDAREELVQRDCEKLEQIQDFMTDIEMETIDIGFSFNAYSYKCATNHAKELDIVIHHTADESPVQLIKINNVHKRQGYSKSALQIPSGESMVDSYIGYHFFIGQDGTLVQTRALDERPLHSKGTIEHDISERSIAIVLAGNFDEQELNREQINSLQNLMKLLQGRFNGEVKGHIHTSATKCPGKNLLHWIEKEYRLAHQPHELHGAAPIQDNYTENEVKQYRTYHTETTYKHLASFDMVRSRYYSVMPDQKEYFRGSYEEDFKVNCQGDCLVTASGKRLEDSMAGKVAACPKEFKFGTRLYIEDVGEVTCWDVGGAITTGRLDIWTGIGDRGLQRIRKNEIPTGKTRVTIVSIPQ